MSGIISELRPYADGSALQRMRYVNQRYFMLMLGVTSPLLRLARGVDETLAPAQDCLAGSSGGMRGRTMHACAR
jgi:uncharacterized protein (UPF0261 family)